MPRLRNVLTGVVVSTSEETATRLGREWEQIDQPAPAKKAAPRKRTAKKATARKK